MTAPSTQPPNTKMWSNLHFQTLLILVVLAGLYLPGLGSYGLYDPWETHYGEVARNMVETQNYIDPYWGSPWDPKSVKRERAGFYSKPPLTMWLMAMGMNLFGFNELGVRFFFPVLMILALMAVFLTLRRLYGSGLAVIGVLVMSTSPFVLFLSRQAVTDGPLVSVMTIGMMALGVALSDPKSEKPASHLFRFTVLVAFLGISCAQLWAILPMDRTPHVTRPYQGSGGLWFQFQWWIQSVFEVGHGKGWFVSALLLPGTAWTAWLIWCQRSLRTLLFCIFYISCGLVVTAKGWLGWAPMGLSIVGFLAITGEWQLLKRAHVGLGLLIVFLTGHPWVVAMLCGHHPGWWNRFIIHDHYKRLFAGVHDLDDGAFEYFFQWLGIGLLPWIAFLPEAFARLISRLTGIHTWTPRRKFELLLGLWAILGFFLFSKSSTKFHHYIFPIVPPLSLLVAITIHRIVRGRNRTTSWLSIIALGLLVWVGQDLLRMPNQFQKTSTPFTKSFGQLSTQNFVNLFTYKYERQWPIFASDETLKNLESEFTASDETQPKSKAALKRDLSKAKRLTEDRARLRRLAQPIRWSLVFAGIGIVLLGCMGFMIGDWRGRKPPKLRQYLRWTALTSLGASGLTMALYCLHIYLPEVSRDWSQKRMWDAYYADCTEANFETENDRTRHFLATASRVPTNRNLFPRKVCEEPIIAFRTNWRGEAFYSANTILPALEKDYLKTFFETYGDSKPFYVFTEKSRIKSELEPTLPKALKGQYTEIFGSNVQFVLLKFPGTKTQ